MNKVIFITGGAGFIGTVLTEKIFQNYPGSIIWVYDSLNSQVHGPNAKFATQYKNLNFIKGNIEDKEFLCSSIQTAQPDIVYHLACETGTGQSYDEIARYCNVNVSGTANLIESLRKLNKTIKLVLSSSRAVYGEGAYKDNTGEKYFNISRDIDKMKLGEFDVSLKPDIILTPVPSNSDFFVFPSSVYAATKLMQEYLLKTGAVDSNIDITILRFQNVYGPGQSLNNPYTGVLSIFCKQILDGKRIEIFEDGNIVRDFVYVDDVAISLLKAGFSKEKITEIIDIGLGKPVTILEAAKLLMRYLNSDDKNYFISGNFRIGDIRYAVADIERAKILLDWAPTVTIEMGLQNLAEWVKNHR